MFALCECAAAATTVLSAAANHFSVCAASFTARAAYFNYLVWLTVYGCLYTCQKFCFRC